MADDVQLNLSTSTGAIIHTDDIGTNSNGAVVHVQRAKIGFGTDGAYGDVTTGNPLPVTLAAGSENVGTFFVGAGTATIGSVNLSTGGAVFLKTPSGGNIPGGTTSGLAVHFGSAQTISLAAGTATAGSFNLSTGGAIYLKTPSGGDIPADTTSGLTVHFGSAQDVNSTLQAGTATIGTAHLASGGSITLHTASGASAMDGDNVSVNVTIVADDAGIGGGTQYAEDSAHNSGDTGTMTLAVRQDTVGTLAGTDGDYAPLQVNADGALRAKLAGKESTSNTTTTPLGSAATYTGTFEQNGYPDVMVSCQTDNSGTLYFDFSVDGTNVTTFPTNGFAVASGTHEFHTAVKGARYFRIRLVNDSGAQSYLRLYTYFGHFSKIPNAPLNQSIGLDSDAIITNSVLAAYNGSAYQNIQSTAGGNLKISLQEASDGMDVGNGAAASETLRVTVANDSTGVIGLNAGTATVGSINLSTGGAIYLKTPSGGDIPADTTSGLTVHFGTAQSVSLPTTQLSPQPSVATGSWGPKFLLVTTSGTTELVTSPGTNTSLYITSVKVSNVATDPFVIALNDGSNRDGGNLAANGGGWVHPYNPPWKLPGDTSLDMVATGSPNIYVTVHFYTGAT